MPIIYHVTTASAFDQAKTAGAYTHDSLKSEGFIHCSLEEQVPGVIERYFKGQGPLVKLEIDTDKLKPRFVFEWSPSTGDTFPHIYGPVNLDAIIRVLPA